MSRAGIDHELTMALMHLGRAQQEARGLDTLLAESVAEVRLQAADLFELNNIRAAREQMARETAQAMVERGVL